MDYPSDIEQFGRAIVSDILARYPVPSIETTNDKDYLHDDGSYRFIVNSMQNTQYEVVIRKQKRNACRSENCKQLGVCFCQHVVDAESTCQTCEGIHDGSCFCNC